MTERASITSTDGLFAVEQGGDGAAPGSSALVFLHGFDGCAEVWSDLQRSFAFPARRTIAFDLPGHGRSLDYPGFGPPKVAARAILAGLERRGIARAHLVGHSMGGAVAALMALFAPERVASLTLFAPGGFGEEIGVEPIRAVMDARTRPELAAALATMGAGGWAPSPADVDAMGRFRSAAGRTAIASIFERLFADGRQGVLPLADLAATGRPVRLLWGSADPVTPHAQGAASPFPLTTLPDVGHLPMLEAPEACRAIVAAALAG